MVQFSPTATLAQMRTWLLSRADEGAHCPLCTQHVKVYRRKINSTQARALIYMYRQEGLNWFHLPTIRNWQSRDEAIMQYWGLIEEQKTVRPDGGRAGYWRVTELGKLWITNPNFTVPKYARIYNGRCLSLVTTEQASIKDALGSKFSYDDLMAGV